MPAPADSPMAKDMWERISQIGEEDSDREDRLGRRLPSRLRLLLVGGGSIDDCYLVDGVNSIDDRSIDVIQPILAPGALVIVPIAQICALFQRYPDEPDEELDGGDSLSTEGAAL